MTAVVGRVMAQKRLASSANGNPRWEFVLDGARVYRTKVDTMIALAVSDDAMIGRHVEFRLDGKGEIYDITVHHTVDGSAPKFLVALGLRASEWEFFGPFDSEADANHWALGITDRHPYSTIVEIRDPRSLT